jgi:glycosyltransferase involved in cell wall biosynthesis
MLFHLDGDESMPDIQVILPTFHRPELLRRAADSVLGQSFGGFELWIVKDGCQAVDSPSGKECSLCERTREVVHDYIQRSTKVQYRALDKHHGGGGYGPRNLAIENSDLPFIAYLDDDNWYEPQHLMVLRDLILSKNVDLVYSGSYLWKNSGTQRTSIRCFQDEPALGKIDTCEILHTRKIIRHVSGWRHDGSDFGRGPTNPNDWDLVSRMLEAGASWASTGIPTTNYVYRG